MHPEKRNTIHFGSFEFDLDTLELRKSGERIPLRKQPALVFALLLRRANELVTREEIRQEVWEADTSVDLERGLNSCIRQIRSALGDSAEQPQYIETIPKRGYRLNAMAMERDEAEPRPDETPTIATIWASIRLWKAAAIVLLLIAGAVYPYILRRVRRFRSRIQSIAVLPLQNLSGDPQQDYFAQGLTDELITTLAQIGSLKVTSRTSVMQYTGIQNRPHELARKLGVDAIVEGTVQRSGKRIHITAELVDGSTEKGLWKASYDRDVSDVFQLESELARSIAQGVHLTLTTEEDAALRQTRAVAPDAHDAYLQGMFLLNTRTTSGIQQSLSYFDQAIQKDSNYAAALAGKAMSYDLLSDYDVVAPQIAAPLAEAAARRALKLDDSLPQAHAALAFNLWHYKWDWQNAAREFQRALQLNGNDANVHHWYGLYLATLGRFDDGQAELRKAKELDPLAEILDTNLGWIAYFQRDYVEAISQLQTVLATDPNFVPAHLKLWWAYGQRQEYDRAIAELQAALPLVGGQRLVKPIAVEYRRSGYAGALRTYVEAMKQLSQSMYVSPAQMAMIYTAMGDKEEAFRWLELGRQQRDGWMVYLAVEPAYDPLRDDPRFVEQQRAIGLAVYSGRPTRSTILLKRGSERSTAKVGSRRKKTILAECSSSARSNDVRAFDVSPLAR